MTPLGWLFLGVSLAGVWGLVIWCYGKVLAAPVTPPGPDDDPPAA